MREGSWDDLFQAAAFDPSTWLDALEQLAVATGSARAEFVGAGGSKSAAFSWVTSADERTFHDFLASGGHSPRTNFRIAADDGRSVLKIIDERHYDQAKMGLADDAFVDFCEQYHMVHGCQTVLLRDADSLVGMSLLRARADGRTTERERAVFADAALAAAKAARLQRAIEDQGHHILAGTFEAMDSACIVFDGRGLVRSMSSAAEQFVGPAGILQLSNGRLSARDGALGRELGKALDGAIGASPARYARLVTRDADSRSVVIELFGLPPRPWAIQFAPRAVAVIRASGGFPADAPQRLTAAFGFTRAEAEVAILLCRGLSREQIAANRGVSAETLRSQLRALYSKVGCNRETELVLIAHQALAPGCHPFGG
jgi:DNA-binding CsgD family transcriptional regulator